MPLYIVFFCVFVCLSLPRKVCYLIKIYIALLLVGFVPKVGGPLSITSLHHLIFFKNFIKRHFVRWLLRFSRSTFDFYFHWTFMILLPPGWQGLWREIIYHWISFGTGGLDSTLQRGLHHPALLQGWTTSPLLCTAAAWWREQPYY